MAAEINPLVSPDVLDALFEDSHRGPVVLFKHSSSCGISAHILEELRTVEASIHVVVVQKHREISNAIEQRTGHRHQSPQAFVIKDGKAVYHASHYGIDVDTISRLLQE
jgi:bacillithiol system protein YtxJ